MKKMFFAVVAMVMMSVNVMANDSMGNPEDFSYRPNMESLIRYLKLNVMQQEEVSGILQYFDSQLERAGRIKGDRKAAKTHSAVMENLKLMHDILSPEQYRKYLTTLNFTLENRGVRKYMS